MDIYDLTKVASMTGHPPHNDTTYDFKIIGEHGRPLVAFSYERREEAEAAHKLIVEAIAKAKLITPMAQHNRARPPGGQPDPDDYRHVERPEARSRRWVTAVAAEGYEPILTVWASNAW
jgi:hypothetical protein